MRQPRRHRVVARLKQSQEPLLHPSEEITEQLVRIEVADLGPAVLDPCNPVEVRKMASRHKVCCRKSRGAVCWVEGGLRG
jgi:hypothetical protein